MTHAQIMKWLRCVIALAAAIEIVDDLAHPHGWPWTGLRVAVAVQFVVGVIAAIAARQKERSSRP